jgi:TonB family protein
MAASLFGVTLGLLLVLLLRRPARRLFGAGPAFTLWLWPPLLAALPWLPTMPIHWQSLPPVLVRVAHDAHTFLANPAGTPAWWLLLWAIGCVSMLLRLVASYVRVRRGCRTLPPEQLACLVQDGLPVDPRRLRLHPQGPAVLWAPRSLVLLPPDFFRHGDAAQRRLILAHECTHLRRGDPLWCLLAEIAVAWLWFHPLIWFALPRFRLDQELACDERTLRDRRVEAGGYARALLSSAAVDTSPALIPWLAEPQLKERLMMIRRERTSSTRRRAGTMGMSLAAIALCLAVQAAPLPRTSSGATQDLAFNVRLSPHYPKASIANREQGLVMLKVRVNTDGTVRTVDYDAKASTTTSANLIAAASDAAMQWRFTPAMKDGRPIESYARVPVDFSLDDSPGTRSQGKTEKKAAK